MEIPCLPVGTLQLYRPLAIRGSVEVCCCLSHEMGLLYLIILTEFSDYFATLPRMLTRLTYGEAFSCCVFVQNGSSSNAVFSRHEPSWSVVK